MGAHRLQPGDAVRLSATERTGLVVSFPGQPLTVVMDDDAGGAAIERFDAAALLAKHAHLFWQARQGSLDHRQFIAAGGRLYSVGDTLRCVERELRGRRVVLGHEELCIDLLNITVQQPEWESES